MDNKLTIPIEFLIKPLYIRILLAWSSINITEALIKFILVIFSGFLFQSLEFRKFKYLGGRGLKKLSSPPPEQKVSEPYNQAESSGVSYRLSFQQERNRFLKMLRTLTIIINQKYKSKVQCNPSWVKLEFVNEWEL